MKTSLSRFDFDLSGYSDDDMRMSPGGRRSMDRGHQGNYPRYDNNRGMVRGNFIGTFNPTLKLNFLYISSSDLLHLNEETV